MTAAAPPRKQRLAIPPADRERIVDGLLEIMSTGQFAYGEWVVRFEALVAEMAGTRHAVATASVNLTRMWRAERGLIHVWAVNV